MKFLVVLIFKKNNLGDVLFIFRESLLIGVTLKLVVASFSRFHFVVDFQETRYVVSNLFPESIKMKFDMLLTKSV